MRGRIAILAILLGLVGAACGTTTVGTATPTGAPETTPPTATSPTPSAPPEDLIVYSGRSESFVAPVVAAFTKATGITVRVRYGDGTGDLATTLINEGETTNADIFWAQDPAWIGAIGDRGLLSALPADVLGSVAPAYSDADGQWVGVTARARVLVYNTDLVSAAELPDSVFDLTDPAWKGRVGVAPTNASFVAFVSAMELVEGPEVTSQWLAAMAANDAQIYAGNGAIMQAVAAGDLAAGLVNHYYLLQHIANQGPTPALNHVFAAGDLGALVMPTGVGVLEPSNNKEAAVEFIRYLLAAEAQEHFVNNLFEYGLIQGAPTPADQVPLADLDGPDINTSDLAKHLESSVTLILEAGLD